MEEKDLFKKISKESENNVPDVYDKILFAANAEGLFNNYDNAEVYSDGETVALGGVNRKAVAITTLASVAAVCLAVALPIALSGKYDGGNKLLADIELGDSYAYGAVTTARLAESFFEQPEGAKAMAKRSSVSSDDFEEFGAYFASLDCLLGKDGVKTSIGEPADYQKSVVISGHRNNGDLFDYAMYYSEYKLVSKSYTDGDPVNYYLEGVISVSWHSGLHLIGERTMSSAAADAEETALTLYAYPSLNDRTTYAQMQLQTEEVDGVAVKSYTYRIVRNNASVSEAVAYKPADADLVIKIKDGKDDKGVFTVVGEDAGGNGYKVNYDLGANKGEMTVKTTDSGFKYEFPDPTVDNSFLGYKDNGDGTYTVSTYDKNAVLPDTLVIPSTYNGKPVVSVGSNAFSYAPFKKVIISDGVLTIHSRAFEYAQMEEIELPSTLNSIGDSAFIRCEKLKELNLPESLRRIESCAFIYCYDLVKVTIPDGIQYIGAIAFGYCKNLTSVNLPASLKTLTGSAFIDCPKLESLTVDAGNPVFHSAGNCVIDTKNKVLVVGCSVSVIPTDGSVTEIGYYAFYRAHLTELNLPSCITVIGENAFGQNDFTSVTLPEGVQKLDKSAFENCAYLESVTFPTTLTWIGENAFKQCYALKAVNIPQNVDYIGLRAFGACDALVSITVDASNTVFHSKDNCIIDTANKTLVAGCKTSVIPDDGSVTTIGEAAFMYCNFTEVTIPSAVTKLEESAFACSDLTQVIMESVTHIGASAFSSCENLVSIEFSKNLKSIGEFAFQVCNSLVSVTLPEGVTTLGEGAFRDCWYLEEVVLPSTLTSVGPQVFKDCRALKTVVLSEGITRISALMFHSCEWLETITIPKSVKYIDFQAFYGCKANMVTINYAGTKAEWEAIEKGEGWDFEFPHTVICSDGEL